MHPQEKVLRASLIEGGAELIGELISGSVGSKHLPPLVRQALRDIIELRHARALLENKGWEPGIELD